MIDLAIFGMYARHSGGCAPGERRVQVHLEATGDFVAWFRSLVRVTGDERMTCEVSKQFVWDKEHPVVLTEAQKAVVVVWSDQQAQAALSGT